MLSVLQVSCKRFVNLHLVCRCYRCVNGLVLYVLKSVVIVSPSAFSSSVEYVTSVYNLYVFFVIFCFICCNKLSVSVDVKIAYCPHINCLYQKYVCFACIMLFANFLQYSCSWHMVRL